MRARPRHGLVYPAWSRRSGGLSIGVNLNPNQACNWRCVYCEVPGLVRGTPPPLDLDALEEELAHFLEEVLHGTWVARNAPPELAGLAPLEVVRDVAFAGDGEPTLSPDLPRAIGIVGKLLERHGLRRRTNVVLITNGSRVHLPEVQEALRRLSALGGEAWFKLDGGTEEARRRINDVSVPDSRVEANLALCAEHVRTWVQTMVLTIDGEPPSETDVEAWLALVGRVLERGAPLRGVLVYGLDRRSHQPEAERLGKVDDAWMDGFAERVRGLGLEARVHR